MQNKTREREVYLQRVVPLDPLLNGIVVIFQCKDGCQTIFNTDHIKEMMRFTAHAVDDPLWVQTCIRDELIQKVVDGARCTEESYRNLTHIIEPLINDVIDLNIQNFIAKSANDPQ